MVSVSLLGKVSPAAPEASLLTYRWRVVQEVLQTHPRSYERGVELRRANMKWAVPIRTMQRWIARIEASDGDINSLTQQRTSRVFGRRVAVSRSFDRAYTAHGYDVNELPLLGAKVDQLIQAAWASPAQRAGWQQVRREVVTAFSRYLHAKEIQVPSEAITLSQRRTRESRYFRIVDIREHDRKTYDDQRPRIRRANNQLLPMQQIVMDVKVVDCTVTRPDGTAAWPRMIAFMDTGTNRLFRRFFLLKAGEGIRQEHVAAAFLEMVGDSKWGFPQQLYRDNGSEFLILDSIRQALQQLQERQAPTIINARPYSGASKPIESKFSTLDRFVFSQMRGWTGGNRMRKKTAHLGKPPAPYPGSFEQFIHEADDRIAAFESIPISSGPFAGKSPIQLIDEHVTRGWRSLLIPVDRIDAAFCTRERRRVSRGYLKISGSMYRHPSLVSGQALTIALPWRRHANPLAFIPQDGWVRLERDHLFAPTDPAGARASEIRRREHDAAVRRLKGLAGQIDLEENHRARLAAFHEKSSEPAIRDYTALPDQKSLGEALANHHQSTIVTSAKCKSAKQRETDQLEAYLAERGR